MANWSLAVLIIDLLYFACQSIASSGLFSVRTLFSWNSQVCCPAILKPAHGTFRARFCRKEHQALSCGSLGQCGHVVAIAAHWGSFQHRRSLSCAKFTRCRIHSTAMCQGMLQGGGSAALTQPQQHFRWWPAQTRGQWDAHGEEFAVPLVKEAERTSPRHVPKSQGTVGRYTPSMASCRAFGCPCQHPTAFQFHFTLLWIGTMHRETFWLKSSSSSLILMFLQSHRSHVHFVMVQNRVRAPPDSANNFLLPSLPFRIYY